MLSFTFLVAIIITQNVLTSFFIHSRSFRKEQPIHARPNHARLFTQLLLYLAAVLVPCLTTQHADSVEKFRRLNF